MATQATDLGDVVITTLAELGENKFTDLMSDYQDTVALKRLIKKSKMNFQAGDELQFNLITDHNNSARFVGLGETDVVDITNVMATGKIPWRHITWNWAMERRLVAMNRSPRKIVDLVKTQRIAAMGSAIIKFETSFWKVPATDDNVSPYGVPYYIVKSNTEGFNGTVPSGYSVVANLSPTTYTRWRNWTAQYTAVTKDDLIRKLRKAAHYTDFKPLVDDIPQYSTGSDRGMYTNYAVLGTMEEILESQNENLGPDIASMDGKVVFRRTPVEAVKELDLDTTNPVYGIDWKEFLTAGLTGEWMKEVVTDPVAGQHTMMATFTDCTFNFYCRNRRKQFVIATNTGLPG